MPPCRAVRCFEQSDKDSLHPDYRNATELEKRFEELSSILQKARDSFGCRLDEGQENPMKELRTRLLKAKDRFNARLVNSSRFPEHGGFYPVQENPFQELRSALRSARKNFVPLLDQYILDNNSGPTVNQSPVKFNKPSDDTSCQKQPSDYSLGDESSQRLHWLLEEETRLRRSTTTTKPGEGTGYHGTSPAGRLESLIHQELNLRRGSLS